MKTVAFPHQRFEKKFNQRPRKCWLWRGAKDSSGYGKMIMGSRMDDSRHFESAHRYSYKFYVGPIPQGHTVLHKCATNACVNPSHLYTGTNSEKVNQAVKRGTWVQAKMAVPPPIKFGPENPNYRHGKYCKRTCDEITLQAS